MGLVVVALLLSGGIGAVLTLRSWREQAYYKNRIARLLEDVERYQLVPRTQAWLADPRSQDALLDDSASWPDYIRKMRPSQVRRLSRDGVSIVWYAGDALGIDVFLPSQRPTRTPLTKDDYYGYQAPYGADAYVWMRFK